MHRIRQPRQLALALLDNRQRQHRQIHAHNAAPHALALPLARPTRTVAAVAVTQQQPHTRGVHDALLHGEPLLVVAARDLEDVAFEFGAQVVAGDLLAHAAVHEHAEFALIFDFDQLLRAVGGVGDVELHLDGGGNVKMWVSCLECEVVDLAYGGCAMGLAFTLSPTGRANYFKVSFGDIERP